MPFQFDQRVAQVFDDMVDRSIPYYHQVMALQRAIVAEYYQQGTVLFDLGCSTGSTLRYLAEGFGSLAEGYGSLAEGSQAPATETTALGPLPRMVGVDASAAMIDKAKAKLAGWDISLAVGDIRDYPLAGASVVLLNYTLQFLPVRDRGTLIHRIGKELVAGGCVLISEKVRFDDSRLAELSRRTYENFKRANGYSESEIQRKKEALDNVLVPLTRSEQLALLHDAGFATVETLFQWNNFVTYLAVKAGR